MRKEFSSMTAGAFAMNESRELGHTTDIIKDVRGSKNL